MLYLTKIILKNHSLIVKLIDPPVQTGQARRGRSIPRFEGLTAGNGLCNLYCASSCLPAGRDPARLSRHGRDGVLAGAGT
jgi:hypothetical protein